MRAHTALISKIIVCDAIIANTDRNRRKFGFIRDVETLRLRPAPLFDSGNCLWYAKTASEVMRRDWSFAVKPFGPVPEQQLALVEDATWFPEESLQGFADEVCEILRDSSYATRNGRLDYIHEGVERQIAKITNLMRVLRWR